MGATVCPFHGGATRNSKAAARRRIESAIVVLSGKAMLDNDRTLAQRADYLARWLRNHPATVNQE